MKVAYLLPINIEKYGGILNKVESQVSAWLKQGAQVKIFLITPNKGYSIHDTTLKNFYEKNIIEIYYVREIGPIPVDFLKDWLRMKSVFTKVLDDLKKFQPDIVYTRNTHYQPFYRKVGKENNLIVEVNTDMYSEYRVQSSQNFRYFLRYVYFLFTNNLAMNEVSGIASVTYEIAKRYKKLPVEVFPNSINISKYEECRAEEKEQRILFIGSPGMPWHGVDILIDLAAKMPEVQFDIIGISETEFSSGFSDNVNFYGYLKKTEYLPLFKRATATIASLAFYRNKMEEACPLKVREYMACCKPVILPYKDTAFERKGYPEWVLRLENKESGILEAVEKVRAFLVKCQDFTITHDDVKEYIDVDYIEKERMSFFKAIMKEGNVE
ncbi:glycosyltransferase [Sinomicrobium sp. M5D2P9]